MFNKMEDLDKLTDAELRHRLLQYGFQDIPVTETTRKILIKRLRNHLTNEKAKINRQTKYVTRYSSDEESENTGSLRGRSNNRNTSISNSMPPPSSPVVHTRRSLASSTPAFTTAPYKPNKTSSSFSTLASTASRLSPTAKQKTSPKIYVPPPILASESEEESEHFNFNLKQCKTTPIANTSYTGTYQRPSLSNLSADKMYGDSWNNSLGSSSSSSPYTPNHCNGQNSPNDMAKRLLKFRGEALRESNLHKRNISSLSAKQPLRQIHTTSTSVDPSDIVYQQPERSTTDTLSLKTAFQQLIAQLDEQYGFKQTFIPCALVSILLLFFFCVAFFYMTISPDLLSAITETNAQYTICDNEITESALASVSYTCIEKDQLGSAIALLKNLVPELHRRAIVHYCKDTTQEISMSAREFVKHLHKNGVVTDVRKTLKDLHNAEYLIERNPQWKINHVAGPTNEALPFIEVVKLRPTQGNHFAILNPRLPLICTISNKIQQFFVVIGTLTMLAVIALAVHISYRFIQNRLKSRSDAIEFYTNGIITELMHKAVNPDPSQSIVIVNHLRDKLIPLHKRKKMLSAWNEAIQNLELYDSRIQFDLTLRNGEECKTMKWIANVSADMIARNGDTHKQWHSPAFDKSNKIANPPTNCLKIRQMFDLTDVKSNPNLKTVIQDAILEKVGPKCKIYDIQLDKQSCCVYVRCATERDAGIVHDEINGWWFDKRLVSIKFLRQQRYLERFPKSPSGPVCLHPSNPNNSSMTQCNKNFAAGVVNGIEDDEEDDDEDDDLDEDEN